MFLESDSIAVVLPANSVKQKYRHRHGHKQTNKRTITCVIAVSGSRLALSVLDCGAIYSNKPTNKQIENVQLYTTICATKEL